jgi:hypothetical protein
MMVPCAPPTIAHPSVLMPDWKTLAQLDFTWSKPVDLDVYPMSSHPLIGFETQRTNRIMLSFEVKIKKPSQWFWSPNYQTVVTGFEAQIEKPSTTLVLRLNQEIHTGFEAKPEETVTTGFEAKLEKTVDLDFEAESKNPRSSSPRAQCRPHMTPPDLSIIRPLSTRPVRSSPVLCIRSPTSAMILIAVRHVAPATCTPRDKQTWFSKWNKDKGKTNKPSWIWIQTSPIQWLITIKSRNWPLGFSISPLMSLLTTKDTKFEVRI